MTAPLVRSLLCAAVGLCVASVAPAVRAAPTPTIIQSFTLKGHEDIFSTRTPDHGTFEVWCQFPDRFVIREERLNDLPVGRGAATDFTEVFGFNGDQVVYEGVWPGGRQTPAGYLPPIPRQADLQPLLPSARQTFGALGAVLFQGTAAALVPDSVQREIQDWAPAGVMRQPVNVPMPIRGEASGYRDVDGVRVPFKVTLQSVKVGPIRVWMFDQIRWNVTIDPKVFKPTGVSGS